MTRSRPLALAILAVVCVMALPGCKTVLKNLPELPGPLNPEEVEEVSKAAEDITPRQEYYIGRAVTAQILDRYSLWEDPEATAYLNLLGQTLAQASDRPSTYKGYRFVILDSDEINAFAAPGGTIMIARGMLRLCETEAEVAAVLAHEIAHVQHKDGLRSIKTDRWKNVAMILGKKAASEYGDQDLQELVEDFENSIQDVMSTLITNGYSSKLEKEADESAVRILQRVGYDASALVTMLEEMDRRLSPDGLDFARTHPDPSTRIEQIREQATSHSAHPPNETRRQRFQDALADV